jgi:hypothetical protein
MSGPDLLISATVPVNPFVGPDGKPLTDVEGFGQVLDYYSGSCIDGVNLKCNSLMSHRRNYDTEMTRVPKRMRRIARRSASLPTAAVVVRSRRGERQARAGAAA